MHRAPYFVAGLAVGLLVGWPLFRARNAPEVSVSSTTTETPSSAPAVSPPAAEQADAERIVFRSRPAAEPSSPPKQMMEPAEEVQLLRQRVVELERKVAAEHALVQEKQGVPIMPPDHLDARFDQEKVRTAVNAALKEAGFDGEATAVDCSEYPCLVVGEIKGGAFGRDESSRLNEAAALGGYKDDSKQSFGTSVESNGQLRNLFGVAIYPHAVDDDEQQRIAKRLRYRFGDIQGLQ